MIICALCIRSDYSENQKPIINEESIKEISLERKLRVEKAMFEKDLTNLFPRFKK